MNFESWFQQTHPSIPLRSALVVVALHGEGATLPFIARYRKEQTGNLDEVAIGKILEGKERFDELQRRREFIIKEIDEQQKLTPELRARIDVAMTLEVLEDLYLPFKRKRKTKAVVARESGLEPLAQWIWDVGHGVVRAEPGESPESKAPSFVNAELNVADARAALDGAEHIIIERLSEIPEARAWVREVLLSEGHVTAKKAEKAKPASKFEHYFEFSEPVQSLMKPAHSHRYLAVRRGQTEEELTVTLGGNGIEESLLRRYESLACTELGSPCRDMLFRCARFTLKYFVKPAIDAEIHTMLKDAADQSAIQVFADNVRTVLLAAPFGARTVLGVDPGIRTGCKLALVERSGSYIGNAVIHLQSDAERAQARELIKELSKQVKLEAIAVGNGTAGRETEQFLRTTVKELGLSTPVVMVSESGASIYSASEVARREFPDLDLTIRGAISIARRLQDPLAELVKVDPKSIGVGQYQHDVNQSALKRSLERVVESCVNSVGVNVNTASEYLLAFVSGIGPTLAHAIVEHRSKVGLFKTRAQLLDVPRFTAKTFEQAAGFLRVPGGENPLDNTGVHPERYSALEEFAARTKLTVPELLQGKVSSLKGDSTLRETLGEFTLADIVSELEKPGRDPREQFVPFEFRADIQDIPDLKPGMSCPGIVTNVTNFGAFVDIGVHQDGLVHLSQLADRFVTDPKEVVNPGDRVTVRVIEVNLEKRQIALTMKTSAEIPTRDFRTGDSRSSSSGSNRRGSGGAETRQDNFKNNPFAGLSSLVKQ